MATRPGRGARSPTPRSSSRAAPPRRSIGSATATPPAAGSGDSVVYGGLQDNGSNKVFPATGSVLDDLGNPINVSSVQVFGGDGGYTLVDPGNSNNVITEYVGLTALKSIDGGANWHFIQPADPNPRFIAPISMDRTNAMHLLAGGPIVRNSASGIAATTAATGAST